MECKSVMENSFFKAIFAAFLGFVILNLMFCFITFHYLLPPETPEIFMMAIPTALAISTLLIHGLRPSMDVFFNSVYTVNVCGQKTHLRLSFVTRYIPIFFSIFNFVAVFIVSLAAFSGTEPQKMFDIWAHINWLVEETKRNFFTTILFFFTVILTYISPYIVFDFHRFTKAKVLLVTPMEVEA